MTKNLYIVPYDFTAVGDAALNYAMHLGKQIEVEIELLHVVKSNSEVVSTKAKLNQIIEKIETPERVTISANVCVGSIFEEISKTASKQAAQLIIMGTHGATGLQKLFGSNAMKVVTSSNTPFLIVQKNTVVNEIKNIVVPVDLSKESLQIVNIAGDIAKIYNAKVHVLGEKQNDELLSQQMKNRILIVRNQYEERNIECSIELMQQGGSYQKKVMEYAKTNAIDLISIAYHSESLLPQFDTFAQSLITNDQNLPCMIINSKPASALYF
jgi:nucleotide-binding universal stress UspA family protein